MNKVQLILMSLICLFSQVAFAQQVLDIKNTGVISSYIHELPHEEGLDIYSVQDKITLFEKYDYNSLEEHNRAIWFVIVLENQSKEEREVILSTSYYDSLVCFTRSDSGNWNQQMGGNKVRMSERSIVDGPYATYRIKVSAQSQDTVFFHAFLDEKPWFQFMPREFEMESLTEFRAKDQKEWVYLLIYLGTSMIMVVYNFLLYFMVRDKTYLYYLGYNIAILFYVGALAGKFIQWFPDSTLMNHMVLLSGQVGVIFYLFFSENLIQLKTNNPKFYKIIKWSIACLCAAAVFTILDLNKIAIPICFAVAIGSYGVILVMSIKRALDGYQPAVYFTIANVFYYVGITISIFQMLDVFPEYLWGWNKANFTEIGMAIQLAFFSLSLGAKINLMREEVAKQQVEQERVRREEEEKRNKLIAQQNEQLERKVKERTYQLEESNEEINQQNEELATQANMLELQNYQLESQQMQLERKNKQVMDSINYASRIQGAMLPSQSVLSKYIPESFVLFSPRDVVSGDFYWMTMIDDKMVLVAGDCTGHGVPGAMMSMIAVNLLKEIINLKGITQPSEILKQMHIGIQIALSQKETNNRDGLDLSLCVIDQKNKVVEFAGAKNPLFYIANGEMQVIKGNKNAIGGYQLETDIDYESHILEYESGTAFYVFSDGYQDQFGGPNNRKFMIKHFRALIYDIHKDPMGKQLARLKKEHADWKGNGQQVDDILVIGFML